MIVAYSVIGKSLKQDMFPDKDGPFKQCPTCKKYQVLYNPKLRVRKTPYALASTWELALVASSQFKEFCEKNAYNQIDFLPFDYRKEYFFPVCHQIVALNLEHRGIEYSVEPCPTCGRYKDHPAILPLFLKDDSKPLEDGIYWSDFKVGIYWERSILIVAPVTRDKMRAAGLKGLEFHPIHQRSDFPDWRDAPRDYYK